MPELRAPGNLLRLLFVGPRLAATTMRVAGGVLQGAAGLVERVASVAGADGGPPAPAEAGREDADHLWDGGGDDDEPVAEEDSVADSGDEVGQDLPAPQAVEPPPPPPPPPPRETAPAHVSEEPVLVSEVAEPGAEDGAGAEVRVEPPWGGYREMSAADVIERMAAESLEVVAVVEMYERMNRGRRSVLDAAQRELTRRSGRGAEQS